ncbi:MAG: hypothetical protein ACLP50_20105 [Solirubrobacteraceae bacterium]
MVAREPSPPEASERSTNEDYWPGRTITGHLNKAARRAPDKLAVIDSRRENHLAASSSARSTGARPAAWLRLGVQPGDAVSFRPRRDFALPVVRPARPPLKDDLSGRRALDLLE